MIGYYYSYYSIQFLLLLLLLFLFIFPITNSSYTYFKTACELLKLPRDCHCQRTRGVPINSLNETRLRCRQLTRLTTDYRWSIVPYDRLAFETPNDNLTLNRFAFADIRARTIRFDVDNLFLTNHAFDNAYIGQLAISHTDTLGRIHFETNAQVFYGTTITNIYIKSIDFQNPISEIIFSNAKIYTFIIQSSKFYGYTNQRISSNSANDTQSKLDTPYDSFLEYDLMLTTSPSFSTSSQSSPLKIRRKKTKKISRQISESSDETSSLLPDQTVTVNITSINLPAFVTVYTVLSSINTTNLTEFYFPNNFEYSQTDEIELSYNLIYSIDAYAFRHLQFFEGRLILMHNHIHVLSPFAFSYLYSLNNLSLANNYIQHLTSKHFEHLYQLNELDLSSNLIEQLPNELFQAMPHLQILRLNQNPLKSIDANLFINLINLKQIHFQGVNFSNLIHRNHSQWLWNLANLHVNYLLNTNFDLSDVAFCLLSRFNQTFFHLPRQHSCSCNIHYLYHNPQLDPILPIKYYTNYLRLTPICLLNEILNNSEFQTNENFNRTEFLLQGLEDKCDYKFIFLDCDAMTTTTTTTTTTTQEIITTIELTTIEQTTIETTTEMPMSTTTPWYFKYTKPPKKSVNNVKKLFTVLGTLVAITIAAIILVILWYRLKAMFKRQKKQKKILEQQKNFNSSRNPTNNHVTVPRYASSDMISSLPSSSNAMGNQVQSEILIEPNLPIATVYKNADALANDSDQNFIDEENRSPQIPEENSSNEQTNEIQETTQF